MIIKTASKSSSVEKQQSLPRRLEISEFRPPVHALKIQIQIKDYLGLEVIRIAQVICKLLVVMTFKNLFKPSNIGEIVP